MQNIAKHIFYFFCLCRCCGIFMYHNYADWHFKVTSSKGANSGGGATVVYLHNLYAFNDLALQTIFNDFKCETECTECVLFLLLLLLSRLC